MIRRRTLTTLMLAASMTIGLHAVAHAADATGTWNGTLKLPGADLRVVIHIESAGTAGYRATLDSPDQGAKGLMVDSITEKDGTLKFAMAQLQASYEGKWDAATKTWVGTFTQLGRPTPLTLAAGNVAGPALVTFKGVGADLDGAWSGPLQVGNVTLSLVLRIKTAATGTSATLDVIEQNASGVPVTAITRDGAKVKFELKSLGATIEGTVAGKTLTGTFSQQGMPFPLVLKAG